MCPPTSMAKPSNADHLAQAAVLQLRTSKTLEGASPDKKGLVTVRSIEQAGAQGDTVSKQPCHEGWTLQRTRAKFSIKTQVERSRRYCMAARCTGAQMTSC
jgi:hypothetical protein